MMTSTDAPLSDRARGWLRFLWDKATTPDDWSSSGEPHEWWDRDSTAPMCSFPRFDLGESAYALPGYVDATPAWREVYTRIARELVERHTRFWAVVDGLTLIGEDPNVDRYPPEWQVYMPERLRGDYPPPGWIGNGIPRWGLNPDPLASDGNLFTRGFFNLLLSVYSYVSGDDTFHRPFQFSGYLDREFTWTQPELARFISEQLAARPEGPHCENTKVWPFCVSSAGLSLMSHDAMYGTSYQDPYLEWSEFAQKHYMGKNRRGDLDWFALYYDPIEREACTFPDHLTGIASLCVTPYIYPQRPDWGLWLYEDAMRKLGWSDPKARLNPFHPDPRFMSIALLMANELGDEVTYDRIRGFAEENFEPRFFGDEGDRFGFFFGWGERYPRGQQSALLMVPELGGAGSWTRWVRTPDLDKFSAPTVEGVDFPALGLSAARNDEKTGELSLRTYAATPSRTGSPTTIRVTGIPRMDDVRITRNGEDFSAWRRLSAATIELDLIIEDQTLVVRTGYRGSSSAAADTHSAVPAPSGAPLATGDVRLAGPRSMPSPREALDYVASCSCC